jgi:DNA-binding transcriptional MerR regulator
VSEKIFRTSEIARLCEVHPNTVRMYEKYGLIAPARRTASGYRQFTLAHLYQMRLARLAFRCTWIGGEIRCTALEMVRLSAAGEGQSALEQAHLLNQAVQRERSQAEAAAAYLEKWAAGEIQAEQLAPLRIGQAARLVNSTVDALRNWERNGLLQVPRDRISGYRLYGGEEINRLRVIRMLLRSGYSMMSVLRMVQQLDRGRREDLRQVLDTPQPGEDVLSASDHWLTSLAEMQTTAGKAVALLEEYLQTLEASEE